MMNWIYYEFVGKKNINEPKTTTNKYCRKTAIFSKINIVV
jgi:hypothetical protein